MRSLGGRNEAIDDGAMSKPVRSAIVPEQQIPSLDAQLAALDAFCEYLPASMRRMVLKRYQMGYEQYGDAWATRDNLAEVLPELADAVVYLFQAVMRGQLSRSGSAGLRACLSEIWVRAVSLRKLPGAGARRKSAKRTGDAA